MYLALSLMRSARRIAGACSGTTRGVAPATASATAATWSGVVPQQPPTMLTSPAWANSPTTAAVSEGPSSYSPNALGSPALG